MSEELPYKNHLGDIFPPKQEAFFLKLNHFFMALQNKNFPGICLTQLRNNSHTKKVFSNCPSVYL